MTSNLIQLTIENFKNIELVELTFDEKGGVFAIAGPNGAGKTSVLDALEVLIASKSGVKLDEPIKTGAKTSRIIGVFDDITIERIFDVKGTRIKVTNNDGSKFDKTPTEALRAFYSHISFDPFTFSQLSEQEQISTLLELTGFDLATADAAIKEHEEARTIANREKARTAAVVTGIADVPAETPDAEESVAELLAKVEQARAWNQKLTDTEVEITKHDEAAAESQSEIERLQLKIKELENDVDFNLTAAEQKRAAIAESGGPVEIETFTTRIANLETTNAAVRRKQELVKAKADAKAAADAWQVLEDKVTAARAAKGTALAAAEMPAGLSIDAETNALRYNDSLFAQASTGQQITVGFHIGRELNPDLKVMVIRDGSLLDTTNRKVIADLADEHGYLVLMETVNEGEPTGVVLSEGAVVAKK